MGRNRACSLITILVVCAALSCGVVRQGGPGGGGKAAPSPAEMQRILYAELARLGVDPARAASAAPLGKTDFTFDLGADVVDPDGAGPLPPTELVLQWTERLIGDYDQNGEVNLSDLAPIASRFGDSLTYRAPVGPVTWWPQGDAWDDGGAGAGNPPAAGSPALDWRLARVDGDNNGAVTLADITPIAQHWKEHVNAYQVWCMGPGPGNFVRLLYPANPLAPLSVLRADTYPAGGTSPDPLRPMCYSLVDVPVAPGIYEYYVVPVDYINDFTYNLGPASNHVTVNYTAAGGAVNQPPTVVLTATPPTGPAPLTVTWDASMSYDPDGSITKFEWDLDQDGTFDYDSGMTTSYDRGYITTGTYTFSVQVTDDQGATSSTTASVTVTPGPGGNQPPTAWLVANPPSGPAPLTVTWDASGSTDPDNNIDHYMWDRDGDGTCEWTDDATLEKTYTLTGTYSMKVIAQDTYDAQSPPATAWVEVTSGTPFWHHYSLDLHGSDFTGASLALIAGHPAVSYVDTTRMRLVYVRATDNRGDAWDTPIDVVDLQPEGGGFTCLADVNGRPGISYVKELPATFLSELHFTRAKDDTGSSWAAVDVIVDDVLEIMENSLAVVNGNPAIAYFEWTNKQVHYIRSADSDGQSWGADVYVDGTRNPCLRVVDGSPAIASRGINSGLYYHRAADANGDYPSSWIAEGSIGLSVGGGAPRSDSLCVVSGQPAIAYDDSYGGVNALRFVRATDMKGGAWDAPVQVLTGGLGFGWPCALLEIATYPLVIYRDEQNTELRSTQGHDSAGAAWYQPMFVEDTAAGAELSAALINGSPAAAYCSTYKVEYAVLY